MELPKSNTLEQELAFYNYALDNLTRKTETCRSEYLCHQASKFYGFPYYGEFKVTDLKMLFPELCKHTVNANDLILWKTNKDTLDDSIFLRITALRKAIKTIKNKLKKA